MFNNEPRVGGGGMDRDEFASMKVGASTVPRPITERMEGGAVLVEDMPRPAAAPGCIRASPIGLVGKEYQSLGNGAFGSPFSGWTAGFMPSEGSMGSRRVRTSC